MRSKPSPPSDSESESDSDNENTTVARKTWPERIRVTGLPWHLMGWNTSYYHIADDKDGFPIYRLDPYTFIGCIPIIGVTIFREFRSKSKRYVWVFARDCDKTPMFTRGGNEFGETPFGYWRSSTCDDAGKMHVAPV